jgi:nucleoside-diphosphate-sugar epimerase
MMVPQFGFAAASKSLFLLFFLISLLLLGSVPLTQSDSVEEHTSSLDEQTCANNIMSAAVLVVGATGATGKHVVHQLLSQGHKVKVIVRSKDRMLEAVNGIDEKKQFTADNPLLTITEASLLDLSDDELQNQVNNVHAVVSCLGHNMDFKGIWGHPRRLVTDATQRLTTAIKTASNKDSSCGPKKFVLMGSDGVANPAGTDNMRPWSERTIMFLLRHLIPPHADNEQAAELLFQSYPADSSPLEWTVVRPTDLVDGPVTTYQLKDKPVGSLFGSGIATRSNVAACMVDMIRNDKLWHQYKFQMPVLVDETKEEETTQTQ